MPNRLIARLLRRLNASPLPFAERLDLAAELTEFLRPTAVMRAAPVVLVVHADARGDNDTSIPD